MQIKDIVNRDIVNLTNCEHEPIHIPGSIQTHGFLLGVKTTDMQVDFCSANCIDFIGVTHEQLLGKSINQILEPGELVRLANYINSDHHAAAPLNIQIAGKHFGCTVQSGNGIHLLEFEPVATQQIGLADVYMQTKQFTTYMQNATTLQALCQSVASETRAITGYDRVMIYKFDKDYNGEVFAESCNDNIEPFLGLHYPHTDIPVQARELYVKNLLRLIADVNYTPVPIYTVDDAANKNLDLSLSTLRSVSPIHIQYLHNMGVGATLTISLIYEGKLWGMITCHHYSPKYISMDTRIAAQLQGHFLTSQISVRQDAEEYKVAQKVNVASERLLAQVFSSEAISFQQLVKQLELLQVANAGGVVIIVDDEIYTHGNLPAMDDIRHLANWLHTYSSPSGFHTEKLADVYPDAAKCSNASGLIYHSLGANSSCIIWCRAEALQEVNWAGDPQKAIVKDEKGLSPRKSFELWKEVKKSESLPWHKPELTAASNFASALQKHVHMLFLSKEELKQRKLSEKLIAANAELENINWIGSHDLKEPLRKIQMFASRILDEEEEADAASVIKSVKKMSESASRMQALVKDILSYSKLAHVEESFVNVNLYDLLQDVRNELLFEIDEKHALIEIDEMPHILGVPVLLSQLFINLLRNALKFTKKGVTPLINITCEKNSKAPGNVEDTNLFYKITIRDNGIGFDNKFNESIFKVFSRLHKVSEYQGTGVGLALCRKIMQNHHGYITAKGSPGNGASFHLYFHPISV